MEVPLSSGIYDVPELREKKHVFSHRAEAGEVLATLLDPHIPEQSLVLAIPAGGVPVAIALASRLNLSLDVAVVSKITYSWNTESGYGAVAFDGTVRLNPDITSYMSLSEEEISSGTRRTVEKVERRVKTFRGSRPFPALQGKTTILVDDGLASGFTMHVAIEAIRRAGAERIYVAVPTGHIRSVEKLAQLAEAVFCANIRSRASFAVADAYIHWDDVDEEEAREMLTKNALSK
jgi:predicted phosphoribosyltransferase